MTANDLGATVRALRRGLGITQEQLALTAGTSRRFIIELERGKPTCQLAPTLRVLQTLGASVDITAPDGVELRAPATKMRPARL